MSRLEIKDNFRIGILGDVCEESSCPDAFIDVVLVVDGSGSIGAKASFHCVWSISWGTRVNGTSWKLCKAFWFDEDLVETSSRFVQSWRKLCQICHGSLQQGMIWWFQGRQPIRLIKSSSFFVALILVPISFKSLKDE